MQRARLTLVRNIEQSFEELLHTLSTPGNLNSVWTIEWLEYLCARSSVDARRPSPSEHLDRSHGGQHWHTIIEDTRLGGNKFKSHVFAPHHCSKLFCRLVKVMLVVA